MTDLSIVLWVADLAVDAVRLRELEATLDPAERRRSAAIPDPDERRRFVADHGFRRIGLGEAMGTAPKAVVIAVDAARRPYVDGPRRASFSASRSEDLALYAVADEAAVDLGVDVETVPGRGLAPPRTSGELTRLAGRIMSARELRLWDAADEDARVDGLYACWTRKEAHGKANGTGLAFPIASWEVWAGDDRPVRHDGVEVRAVDLTEVVDDAGRYRAALAVRVDPDAEVCVVGPRRVG